jgi:DnaJ-class molecular chaperone
MRCTDCNGTGRNSRGGTCRGCDGSGVVADPDPQKRCNVCNGTGRDKSKVCRKCNGTGYTQ